MVEQLLRKTTGPAKCPPAPMPHPAIVPFYRVLFPYSLVVFPKRGKKAVPIIRRYPVIALSPAVLSSSSAFAPSLNLVSPIQMLLFPRFPDDMRK
jgi:hypothetical protein